MKAAVYARHGPTEIVAVKDVEKPVPKDNEVLIKVRAASVNPLDYHLRKAPPFLVRIAGRDVAGTVEAVGRLVTQFKPGDDVFGASVRGTFAEFVCAREDKLALKPAKITFEQAAAVPVAGISALQGLRDKGRLQAGQHVLINGAAGGVGTFAVQIAKAMGAEVTGVCSTRNVELVRSIGADRVIDYTRENFTQSGQRYDMILDCVGSQPLSACRRVMNPKAVHVLVGGPVGFVLRSLLLSPFVSQKVAPFLAHITQPDLNAMKELIEAGQVTPVLDRSYPLQEAPAAIRHLAGGHARGKIIITV